MFDGEGKFKTQAHAHVAGLRRLSRRANTLPLQPRRQALSFSDYGRAAIHRLRQKRVAIAPGLSGEEFERIEAIFRFTFPPDLRAVLREGVPVGLGFPDWRRGGVRDLRTWMNQPITGLRSEAEQRGFWWGPRPEARDARTALKKVPILVPLYGRCFVSVQPSQAGNPIFFIHKKQIWYCALDVADFFDRFDFDSGQFDQPTEIATDQLQEDSEEFVALTDDPCSRKEAESEEILENWGRNLDALGRNSEILPRSTIYGTGEKSEATDGANPTSGSSNSSSPGKSKDTDQEDLHFSSEFFMQFSETDSTLAAKIARRIEFWSDLADRQRRSNPVPESPATASIEEDRSALTQFRSSFIPKWLALIVDDMSVRLRKGGWKEDEISEIMGCFSSPSPSGKILSLSTQSASENLALQLDFLSATLRKAGWSIQDVAEALLLDLTPDDHTIKACTRISPELAARIVPLTQFVVDS